MFGRSTVSANSDPKEPNGRPSNETRRGATTPVSVSMSLPGSPSTKRGSEEGGAKPRQRRKRSTDASRPTDRLSLFGGSISIGRARKPAPRVPSCVPAYSISAMGINFSFSCTGVMLMTILRRQRRTVAASRDCIWVLLRAARPAGRHQLAEMIAVPRTMTPRTYRVRLCCANVPLRLLTCRRCRVSPVASSRA